MTFGRLKCTQVSRNYGSELQHINTCIFKNSHSALPQTLLADICRPLAEENRKDRQIKYTLLHQINQFLK
jgi:hypothetical protein